MEKKLIVLAVLVFILLACSIPALTGASSAVDSRTITPVDLFPTFTPTIAHIIMCTPPPCAGDESYHCPSDCPGGCGTVCATHTPDSPATWWQPEPGLTFHIQYSGEVDLNQPVDVYNLDLFETSSETITQLHDQNIRVICYFSAGSFEDWRPDAALFPEEVLGSPLDNWPGEAWLDIRRLDALGPIMSARLDLAKRKSCDAVDPDNMDGYANSTGFDLSFDDQLIYNRWLAEQAHIRKLAVGLKNDLAQIPDLAAVFDFAVNEECYTYQECDQLAVFISKGKPVFGIEYQARPEDICPPANASGFSFTIKNLELDESQIPCWGN